MLGVPDLELSITFSPKDCSEFPASDPGWQPSRQWFSAFLVGLPSRSIRVPEDPAIVSLGAFPGELLSQLLTRHVPPQQTVLIVLSRHPAVPGTDVLRVIIRVVWGTGLPPAPTVDLRPKMPDQKRT